MSLFMEMLGWAGAALVLIGYGLLSAGRVSGDSYGYHLLNMLGALLLVFYMLWKDALPSALLNIIWCLIGLYALRRIYLSRKA